MGRHVVFHQEHDLLASLLYMKKKDATNNLSEREINKGDRPCKKNKKKCMTPMSFQISNSWKLIISKRQYKASSG